MGKDGGGGIDIGHYGRTETRFETKIVTQVVRPSHVYIVTSVAAYNGNTIDELFYDLKDAKAFADKLSKSRDGQKVVVKGKIDWELDHIHIEERSVK